MTALSEKWFEKNPWAVDREYRSTREIEQEANLSDPMQGFMPGFLFFVKDGEEKTFTVRGVKVKALFYIVLFAVVFAFWVAVFFFYN